MNNVSVVKLLWCKRNQTLLTHHGLLYPLLKILLLSHMADKLLYNLLTCCLFNGYFANSLVINEFISFRFYFFLSRLQYLSKSRQKDKQSCVVLEKKARVETESRLAVEKQLEEVRSQKFDEAAFLLRNASNRYKKKKSV